MNDDLLRLWLGAPAGSRLVVTATASDANCQLTGILPGQTINHQQFFDPAGVEVPIGKGNRVALLVNVLFLGQEATTVELLGKVFKPDGSEYGKKRPPIAVSGSQGDGVTAAFVVVAEK